MPRPERQYTRLNPTSRKCHPESGSALEIPAPRHDPRRPAVGWYAKGIAIFRPVTHRRPAIRVWGWIVLVAILTCGEAATATLHPTPAGSDRLSPLSPVEPPPRPTPLALWGPMGFAGLAAGLLLGDWIARHRLARSLMSESGAGQAPWTLVPIRASHAGDPSPMGPMEPATLAGQNRDGLSIDPPSSLPTPAPFLAMALHGTSECDANSPAPAVSANHRPLDYASLWHQIVAVTSEAEDFELALEGALQVLGEATDWVAGEAWVSNLDSSALECSPAWFCVVAGLDLFRKASLGLTFGPGCDQPGRAWQNQYPEWVGNYELESIERCSRSQMALGVGLRSSVALPILSGERVLAVLVLFSPHPRDCDPILLSQLARMTGQLGPVLQHKQAEVRYRNLFERAIEGIFQVAPDGRYLHANPAFATILGYESPSAAVKALNATDRRLYVRPSDEVYFLELLENSREACNFECQVYRQDGQRIWVDQRAQAVRDRGGRLLYYEGCLLDITSRKWVEAQLQYNSSHDVLTGLWNRAWFLERLVDAVSRCRRDQNFRFALLFIDIDGFKRINNSLGYWMGDRLLMMLAGRLEKAIPPDRVLARTGGDEFVVLLEYSTGDEVPGSGQFDLVTALAAQIQDVFHDPFVLDGRDVFLQASIGIVCRPESHQDARPDQPYRILRDADTALQRAKQRRNGSFVVFDAALQSDTEQLLQLETDLRWAIERREFRLHYQPIVCLDSYGIVGFESLIRWQHPQQGLLMPNAFIGLAEDRGAILPIGNWVLQSACKQIADWKARIPEVFPLWLNINLSARQLVPELADLIEVLMDAYDLNGGELRLEITETSLALDPKASRACLERLRERHIKICLDDFGTGYCSLNYLREFPIDAIKIERSFIQAMLDNQRDAAIVRAIINLANDLGLSVIAEGIETTAQSDRLRALGCGFGQGYLFSRAVPIEQATEMLTTPSPTDLWDFQDI